MAEATTNLGLLLSGLVEDWTGSPDLNGGIELKPRGFRFGSMLKEIARVSKLMCAMRSLSFEIESRGKFPGQVTGDDTSITQAILFMVVKALNFQKGGTILLSVVAESGYGGSSDPRYIACKQQAHQGSVLVKFFVGFGSPGRSCRSLLQTNSNGDKSPPLVRSFCERLAKLMNASASIGHNSEGLDRTLNLAIRLPIIFS